MPRLIRRLRGAVTARHSNSRLASSPRGQSLVEFAIMLPMLLMLVGGIAQYGMIFATKHSLIEVARDVGRWASTQRTEEPVTHAALPCRSIATATPPQPVTQANAVAIQSRLMGYSDGMWNSANFTLYPDNSALPATPPATEGVEVVWSSDAGSCPPSVPTTVGAPTEVSWVTIRLSHRAPVVLPGFPYLPGLGTCDATGCYFAVTTTSQFRMEPVTLP